MASGPIEIQKDDSMDLTIFCPQCDTLIVDAPACSSCAWRRPAPAETGTQVWQYNPGAKLRCTSLTLSGERLCFGDAGHSGHPGAVHAVALATGEGLWRTPLPQGTPSDSLAEGGGLVFVSATEAGGLSPDKPLLALDAATGEVAWTYHSGALNLSAPLFHHGLVYAASSDRRLHALDAASGKRLWVAELAGWGRAAPAIGGGTLFMGTEQDRLLALDLASGRERWSLEGKAWFAATPAVYDGVVYAACWDGSLYALQADSGELLWRHDLGSHAYLLTSPIVEGEQVLVGSRDHALYALDQRTGEARWRFETGRRVYAAPAVAGGLVHLGSDDRHLYALDGESGGLRWQIDLPGRCRTTPLAAGQRLYVACQGGEVLALALGEEEAVADPENYLAQEEYDKAAAALALNGQLAEAAKLYAKPLDQPYRAAQLYEQAGEAMKAARRYEQAGHPERALDLWRQVGKTQAAARILQELGRPLEAAEELEEGDLLMLAADLYLELGQPSKAGHLYRRAGKPARALECWIKVKDVRNEIVDLLDLGRRDEAARRYEEVGEYARAADLYMKIGQPELAAAMWVRQGQHRLAAELYEQAGDLPAAAAQYEGAEEWAKAADLHLRMGQQAGAARCYEAKGDWLRAGTLYEDAALELEEQSRGKEEGQLADLFGRAAECFTREYEVDRRDRCRQKERYYRHQPNLTLLLKQDEPFVQDVYNYLTVELFNHGRGVAYNVEVALVPAFEGIFSGELTTKIRGIARQGSRKDTLAVHPKAPGKLTLDVRVGYCDRPGETFEEKKRWFVEVRSEPSTSQFTPREIHVHGDYVEGKKVEGDVVEDGGQKGDRVEIHRGASPGLRLVDGGGTGLVCQACGKEQSLGAAYCENCGLKLEVTT
jgi:outer membrane protein assembly factor BamB